MPPLREVLPPEWRPWLLALGLALLLAAVLEAIVRGLLLSRDYDWMAAAASLGDAAGRRLIDALGLSLVTPVMLLAHEHRLADIALDTGWAWLLLLLGQDFAYYWGHRLSHRVHWFWASHSVHHSPNQLSLVNALRLGWTGRITGSGLLMVPLAWLGFEPVMVAAMVSLNLMWQYGLHAPWMPRLGPLEWVFNTPVHHRLHHASNPEYLDGNYGGVLIVFDRLFGSFHAERPGVTIRYGLTEPLYSNNPLRINLHGWQRLWRALRQAQGLRGTLTVLFGPPQAASDLTSPAVAGGDGRHAPG